MTRREELSDEQWELIRGFLPVPEEKDDPQGRPKEDDRAVLNGILWVLRSESPRFCLVGESHFS